MQREKAEINNLLESFNSEWKLRREIKYYSEKIADLNHVSIFSKVGNLHLKAERRKLWRIEQC